MCKPEKGKRALGRPLQVTIGNDSHDKFPVAHLNNCSSIFLIIILTVQLEEKCMFYYEDILFVCLPVYHVWENVRGISRV